ncbi:hypothetical protein NLX86_32420 [Streptomyces sp. A3M-1-3]|uniref:COG4315 family predicted lipoprotein n=1 Tax=Streptomyces sp. A3M-1-3 TaxID=2962044 RepID=UPI0020B83D2D|nr:hypothetical protein [Streptomyces sp. A3M-1-3]MCP3822620.1 hypothetical protein [Streptomyces sp. A3M-1-3]
MKHAAKVLPLFVALLVVSLVALLVVAVCSSLGDDQGEKSPAPSPTATATAASVAVRASKLGQILVDGQGRTLYLFEADTSEESTCSGACVQAWPPLTSVDPKAGKGVDAGLLGTTTRDDGSTEVTYNGRPLYSYVGDTEPGDTAGQGLDQFGATWFVLNAAGSKVGREGSGYY